MKNAASEHQKLRKKIRKFTLKLAEIKKKNKKKIGSNVDNLRNLEPQPEQTFLIKKNKCTISAQHYNRKEVGGLYTGITLPQ